MVTVTCDRCKKKILNPTKLGNEVAFVKFNPAGEIAQATEKRDLCDPCYKLVRSEIEVLLTNDKSLVIPVRSEPEPSHAS